MFKTLLFDLLLWNDATLEMLGLDEARTHAKNRCL